MNFKLITRFVVIALIASVVALAFISILSIWDVIKDDDIIWKSLTTIVTLVVVGAVTLTSLKFLEDRENKHLR